MPKAFSEQEKDLLRQQLLDKGKELFELHGLKKTTVEDLTRAVGISKGAFYLFFDSKEYLYLEILEKIERQIQTDILDFAMSPGEETRLGVTRLLKKFVGTLDEYSILMNFTLNDFNYLLRKIPAERFQQHVNNDQAFLDQLFAKLEQEEIKVAASPEIVSNMFRGLFYISLHRDEFSGEGYPAMMDVYVHLIAGYISGEYNDHRS